MMLSGRIRASAQTLMKDTEAVGSAQATDDVIRILRATDKLVHQRGIAMKAPIETLSADARTRIRHDMRNHLNIDVPRKRS